MIPSATPETPESVISRMMLDAGMSNVSALSVLLPSGSDAHQK